MSTIPLTERYRPRTLDDVIGQDRAVAIIRRMPSLAGHAFWVAGPSGTGKTTLARIIASKVADPYATCEIDGGDVSIDWLRWVENSWRVRPLVAAGHRVALSEWSPSADS